jgi:hypothetical protein
MDYQVVFDISQGYHWSPFLLTGLTIDAGCLIALAYLFLTRAQPNRKAHIFAIGCVVFVSTLLVGNSFGSTYPIYRDYQRLLEGGHATVVEGPITDFRPEPWQGHAPPERFVVNGVAFEYSYFTESPGFHTTAARGGPLRNGQYVRIHYTGMTILKLELKQ